MMRKTILVRMMTFDNFRIIILEYNIIKNHIKNLFKNHIFVRNDIKLNHIKKHIENILKQPFKTKNNIKTTDNCGHELRGEERQTRGSFCLVFV